MTLLKVKGKWYVQVMRDGEIYTAGKGFDKKEDSQEAQALLKAKFKKARTRTLLRTFYDLWIEYLNHSEQFNSKVWYDAKRYIGYRYFKGWFSRNIETIYPGEIEKHLAQRKLLSPRSANLDFEILRSFFNWCKQMGHIDRSPIDPLRKYPMAKKIKPIPAKAQIDKLIQSNKGADRLFILFLVYSLGRISEIKKLRWEEIDLKKKILYLRTRKTKDGSEMIRAIPIAKPLYTALKSEKVKEGYVLRRTDGRPYRDLRKWLKRCLKGSQLLPRFHQFRHYSASQLMAGGVDAKTIQELLGHTSLETTNIYLQSLEESKRKAVEKL